MDEAAYQLLRSGLGHHLLLDAEVSEGLHRSLVGDVRTGRVGPAPVLGDHGRLHAVGRQRQRGSGTGRPAADHENVGVEVCHRDALPLLLESHLVSECGPTTEGLPARSDRLGCTKRASSTGRERKSQEPRRTAPGVVSRCARMTRVRCSWWEKPHRTAISAMGALSVRSSRHAWSTRRPSRNRCGARPVRALNWRLNWLTLSPATEASSASDTGSASRSSINVRTAANWQFPSPPTGRPPPTPP